MNWGNYKTSNRLAALLRRGYDPIRSVQSHNSLEDSTTIGNVQQGGTATVLQGTFSKFVKKRGKSTGVDHTGLGRWSWYTMEGEHGVRTRIISAYAPVGGKDSGPESYWKQHLRYIQNKSLNATPFNMFCDDLCEVLKTWRSRGDRIILMMDANDRIILMMDANDNVFNGKLSKRLADELIEMKEAVEAIHGVKPGQGPNTHSSNTKSVPIDGI